METFEFAVFLVGCFAIGWHGVGLVQRIFKCR
jgi:hypothetical protein